MASHVSNPYLALVLLLGLLFSSKSFASVAKMGQFIKTKNYNAVVREFRNDPRKKLLLNDPRAVMYVAIASENLGAYKQAYYFYLRLLFLRYGNYYRMIQKKLDAGDFIEAEKLPSALKVQYWKIYTSIGKHILTLDKLNANAQKDVEILKKFSVILTEFAFREDLIEKLDSSVDKHITELKLKKDEFVWRLYADIISWQREVTISSSLSSAELVLTNQGICAGGSFSFENHYRSYFLDACFAYGTGSISSVSGINYEQGGVPVMGLKFAPGMSFFVSEDKAEIGFKIPFFYNIQELENPDTSVYTIDNGSDLSYLLSLYSRWPVKNFFFHTEFSKFLDQDTIMWSFGVGMKL